MAQNESEDDVYKQFQDLVLDLNLDQTTADEAWGNYQTLKLRYVMEGEQLSWVACAVYGACQQRTLPTVGGRPGSTVQGNCVSLTRMLHYCSLTFMEFIKKQRLWMRMAHLDSSHIKSVDLLETKYAVSNNIYKKYRPIFLDLFNDPDKDAPRPVRSRKQRKPPCNATELYHFCWTLYILVKGKFPAINQELVMSYSLLLSCIDLLYINVKSAGRTDLLNKCCAGYPAQSHTADGGWSSALLPESIMDYLCRKFEGVTVETKVVREYYWKPNVKKLIDKKLLKGNQNGLCLLDCQHFEHNVKEVRNAYETDLLSSGEFDERMFLSNDRVMGVSGAASPVPTAPVTPMSHLPRRGLMLPGDYHLMMPQTPISGRAGNMSHLSPGQQQYSPLAAAATALHRLYSLLSGRTKGPSPELVAMLGELQEDPVPRMKELLTEMGTRFCKLYCATETVMGPPVSAVVPVSPLTRADQQQENISPANTTNNGNTTSNATTNTTSNTTTNTTGSNDEAVVTTPQGPTLEFAKMRLKMAQMLFYVFLESIIQDEIKRGVDIQAIVKQELFFRTLFVCCVELVLKCYNDPRKFPWALQIGDVAAYYFVRIIEPVVRSEQQCDNRLSRELVNHLKMIEEQILDSLAWTSVSPVWEILKEGNLSVPSCKDVNFSHLLDNASSGSSGAGGAGSGDSITSGQLAPPHTAHSVIMSPAVGRHGRPYSSPRQSPLSTAASERLGLQSPPGGNKGSVKRTLLFPASDAASRTPVSSTEVAAAELARLPTSSTVAQQKPQEEVTGERPRRHGSLAIFFRKVYNVANLRLCDLCDRLQIVNVDLRRKIWTCLEFSILEHTYLLRDRHLDQLIMCAIYTMCKVTREDRIFQDIMKQYRCQAQADSHIYRSVLIKRLKQGVTAGEPNGEAVGSQTPDGSAPAGDPSSKKASQPSLTPVECSKAANGSKFNPLNVNGTSAYFKTEERGDLIKFYNCVYVQHLKTFALKFKSTNQDGCMPPLSPLPIARVTPVSPRRRISSNRPVYVHSLSPVTSAMAASPRRHMPYIFNKSPAKDLRVINSMVHLRSTEGLSNKRQLPGDIATHADNSKRPMVGLSRRLNTVLDERQRSTDNGLPKALGPNSLVIPAEECAGQEGSMSSVSGVVVITNGARPEQCATSPAEHNTTNPHS